MKKTSEEKVLKTIDKKSSMLVSLKALDPAPMVQSGSQPMVAVEPDLDFPDMQWERIDTGLPPVVKWTNVGQYVKGIYKGLKVGVGAGVGIYQFTYRGKAFGVWSSYDLDRAFQTGVIEEGDAVKLIYVADVQTDQPNPMRQFEIHVGKNPDRARKPEVVSE